MRASQSSYPSTSGTATSFFHAPKTKPPQGRTGAVSEAATITGGRSPQIGSPALISTPANLIRNPQHRGCSGTPITLAWC